MKIGWARLQRSKQPSLRGRRALKGVRECNGQEQSDAPDEPVGKDSWILCRAANVGVLLWLKLTCSWRSS